jgi:hypothetical protein
MLSTLSNVPSWVFEFFGNHYELLIGYVICVLFPVPWLNSWIISLWQKVLSRQTTTPTPPASS